MNRQGPERRAQSTAVLALGVLLAAGANAQGTPARAPVSAAKSAARTARALVVERPAVAGRRQFDVILELGGTRAGAYQGILRFTPGLLKGIEGKTRGSDGSRFVNLADTAKGSVRFAGYTVVPTGFADSVMLSVSANFAGPVSRLGITVTLEAIGDANGVALKRDEILPFGGVRRAP